MQQSNTETLNKILQGEFMAIQAYEQYLKKVDDEKIAEQLSLLLEDHKSHAYILSTRIRELGDEPKENTGIAGVMAEGMTYIKTLTSPDSHDIIEELYNGEDMGISAALNLAEEGLDTYDKQLIEEIMSEDYQHLKVLGKLLM